VLLLAGCAAGTQPEALPIFTLTDQTGHQVSAAALRGQALVVSFIFTTCHDVCPLITAQLARAQARVRSDGLTARVRFVSITVDPAVDTPPVLARYASRYGIDQATWHFLTGPPDEVARVVRELGVVTAAPSAGATATSAGPAAAKAAGRVGHTSLVLFVDPQGRVAERFTSLDLDVETVLGKIRRII
jgi:protein SCO1/2